MLLIVPDRDHNQTNLGKWEIYVNNTEYISQNWRVSEQSKPEQGRNAPGFQNNCNQELECDNDFLWIPTPFPLSERPL